MASERIRVRLRGFDTELVDQSAKAIVQTTMVRYTPARRKFATESTTTAMVLLTMSSPSRSATESTTTAMA